MSLPHDARVEYATVLATMASVDGVVRREELQGLAHYCRSLSIRDEAIEEVLAAARMPDPDRLSQIVRGMRTSPMRFTLLTDLLFIAKSDREFSNAERAEIHHIASELEIHQHQLDAMETYVDAVISAGRGESDPYPNTRKLRADVTAALAAAGVPLAAVAIGGYALSAPSIVVGGLQVLGLGFGIGTGLGVAAGIGIGSYFAVKWLYAQLADD